MGYFHEVVVDDVGQVVGRQAVGLEQDGVSDLGVGHGDVAADDIGDDRRTLQRGLEADGKGRPGRFAGGKLVRGQIAAAPVIALIATSGFLGGATLFQLVGRAEAFVGVVVVQQPLRPLAVEVGALALDVGTMGAADAGAFVPVETHPAQGVDEGLRRALDGAFLVGVLDAQDELAAVFAGEHPVIEGGARPADMEVAGGAGCESYAYGHKGNPQISQKKRTHRFHRFEGGRGDLPFPLSQFA